MRSKFQQNAILCGYINSFCLVCECHLDSEAVAIWHIDQYEHKKNLDLFPYLEKYKNDSIRKLKAGYFCEYCNKLINSISNIGIHINEANHIDNKVYKSFERVHGSIVAFNKTIIDEKAWHSITDKTCAICNIEFENEDHHKSDASHILKLIQSTVKLHGNGVYRIMNEDTFQCLTCNNLVAYDVINEHFNSSDHQKLYAGCQRIFENKYGAIRKDEDQEKRIKGMVEQYFFGTDPDIDTEDLDDDDLFGYIPADFPSTSDTVLLCLSSEDGKLENAFLTPDPRQQKDKTVATKLHHNNNDGTSNYNFRSKRSSSEEYTSKKQDEEPPVLMCDKSESDIAIVENIYKNAQPIYHQRAPSSGDSPEQFALRNHMIKASPRDGHVYCKLCTTKVSFFMEDMKNHVFTRKHRSLLVLTAYHEICTLSGAFTHPTREFTPFRMPMIDFIFDSRYSQDQRDVLVNRTFCITTESFNLLYKVSTTHLMCHVCNYKQPFEDSDAHLDKAAKHIVAMNLSLVLTELVEEFIREISQNKFHCGFCNLVIPSLRDLKDHMRGDYHKEQKLSAYRRLHRNHPIAGQMAAINAIMNGQSFTPNWTGRKIPGTY